MTGSSNVSTSSAASAQVMIGSRAAGSISARISCFASALILLILSILSILSKSLFDRINRINRIDRSRPQRNIAYVSRSNSFSKLWVSYPLFSAPKLLHFASKFRSYYRFKGTGQNACCSITCETPARAQPIPKSKCPRLSSERSTVSPGRTERDGSAPRPRRR